MRFKFTYNASKFVNSKMKLTIFTIPKQTVHYFSLQHIKHLTHSVPELEPEAY